MYDLLAHLGATPLAVWRPRGPVARMRGLLARPAPPAGAAALFAPCRSLHTIGMGYPIDVVWLDREWHVLAVHAAVHPHRIVPGAHGARAALELRAGEAARLGIATGARLVMSHSAQ